MKSVLNAEDRPEGPLRGPDFAQGFPTRPVRFVELACYETLSTCSKILDSEFREDMGGGKFSYGVYFSQVHSHVFASVQSSTVSVTSSSSPISAWS